MSNYSRGYALERRVAPLPLTISEAVFQQTVVDTAILHRCHVAHFRPAQVRNGRWATPMTGHPGFPDLVIARDGWVILAELKRHGGRVAPAQRDWLAALGMYGRLWTPSDWPRVYDKLRNGPKEQR